MKQAIIVFYSYSGNTLKASRLLQKELDAVSYQTQLLRLEPLDESASFFKQCARAFLKKQARLKEDVTLELAEYDLVAFGTPVWAFCMAPALRTYLTKCTKLTNKKAILFVTCGSGLGVGRCIQEMVSIAENKGAADTRSFLIPQSDVNNQEKAAEPIKESLKQWV